jgi:hypothetical protein
LLSSTFCAAVFITSLIYTEYYGAQPLTTARPVHHWTGVPIPAISFGTRKARGIRGTLLRCRESRVCDIASLTVFTA